MEQIFLEGRLPNMPHPLTGQVAQGGVVGGHLLGYGLDLADWRGNEMLNARQFVYSTPR